MKLFINKLEHLMYVAIICLIIVILPIMHISVSPEWAFTVVNSDGVPQSDIQIRQSWNNYSYNVSGEETIKSNKNGLAKFSQKSFTISLMSMFIGKIGDIFMIINPHASFGSNAYVYCLNAKCKTIDFAQENLPKTLVVNKTN